MLSGKNALVTGASSGIGRSVAAALADRGCSLILSGRAGDRLQATAAACRGASRVATWPGDLTDPGALDALRRAVEADLPSGIDILIHCAADLLHGEIEQVKEAELRRILEINIVAAFGLLRVLNPLLAAGADVVFLNSSHGIFAPAGTAPYAATKFALRALAEAFRAEVKARGIRVTSVYCGKTATEMQKRVYEERGEGSLYNEIKDEILHPEDVAEIIVSAISLPATAEVTDIHIRPAKKTPGGLVRARFLELPCRARS